MMWSFRLSWIAAVLLILCRPAAAELACLDMYPIARLLSVSETNDSGDANFKSIYQDVSHLHRQTTEQIQSNRDLPALQPFAQLMMLLMEDMRRSDNQALYDRLKSRQSATTLTGAASVLERQGCEPIAGMVPNSNLQGVGILRVDDDSSSGETGVFRQITADEAKVLGASGIMLAIAAPFAFAAYKRHRRRRRRRHHRYPCNIDGMVQIDAKDYEVRLLDLNCYGAKLRNLNDFEADIGAPLTLTTGDRVIETHIAWQNQHFCGVTFDQRLLVADVEDMIGTPTSEIEAKEKAAPIGTA